MTEKQIYTWIFLSVSEFQQPASLQEVIAVADFINHAIPVPKELQKGFGWLRAQGLVRKEREKYSLTETGIALRTSISFSSIHKICDMLAIKLAQLPEIDFQPDDITEAEVTAAYKSYRKMGKAKKSCKFAKKKGSELSRNEKEI